MRQPYVLVVGMGRSGTTALANVLSCRPDLLYVDEPNFVDALYIPFALGSLTPRDLLLGLGNEGWRGPMKFCRSLSETYPAVFGDTGESPVRPYMQREFKQVVSDGQSCPITHRPEIIRNSLCRILEWTCRASGRRRWLVKQPRLVLSCEYLVEYWKDMRVIHVARRLEYVLRSRLIRGYQPSFSEALRICVERLEAAAHLRRHLGSDSVMHVRIEDIAESPKEWIKRICDFAKLDIDQMVINEAEHITRKALYALGTVDSFFTSEERAMIEAAREKANHLLGLQLV